MKQKGEWSVNGRRPFTLVPVRMPMPKIEQPVPHVPPSSTAYRWPHTPSHHHSPVVWPSEEGAVARAAATTLHGSPPAQYKQGSQQLGL